VWRIVLSTRFRSAGHIELETSPPVAVRSTADPSRQLASLSAREREVLAALADGLTNQELADRLFISERAANRHLSNIVTKLGVLRSPSFAHCSRHPPQQQRRVRS
jgi:DNA-binding CsgD family transcriptional regulator